MFSAYSLGVIFCLTLLVWSATPYTYNPTAFTSQAFRRRTTLSTTRLFAGDEKGNPLSENREAALGGILGAAVLGPFGAIWGGEDFDS